MSDFVFSNQKLNHGHLTNTIRSIYEYNIPKVFEYHGDWGSLAVSKGHYRGFLPLETVHHICIVLAGPVLEFCENDFLMLEDSNAGTDRIYQRIISNTFNPLDDLNGPFVIFLLDKQKCTINLIMDIGMYIPVYFYKTKKMMVLGSHVDLVAAISNQTMNLDQVSLVDFFINAAITHPHTVYKDVFQMNPSSTYIIDLKANAISSEYYWTPQDDVIIHDINQAADIARSGLQKYVNQVTSNLEEVASFISGGEDSRFVLALLPQTCKKDTYTFLDSINKEGEIAQAASQAYGGNFNLITRDFYHYLDILKPSSRLIGNGSEYMHCHTFRLSLKASLDKYSAVFGGYQGDTILKAYWLKVKRYFGERQTKLLSKSGIFSSLYPIRSDLIKPNLIEQIRLRKKMRLDKIASITNNTQEWYHLWPRTMGPGMVNYFCNRRLFASYEPFMIKELFFVVAATPPEFRLKRKLYHLISKPYFKKSMFLKNVNGTLPYFHTPVDNGLVFFYKATRRIRKRLLKENKNQYSWADWYMLIKSKRWENEVLTMAKKDCKHLEVFNDMLQKVVLSPATNIQIKLSILQTIHLTNKV